MSKLGSNINSGLGVELGSMTTATRNAGVSTASGTLIYNSNTESIEAYGPAGWTTVQRIGTLTATGGTILTPGNGYRYHIWTSPGSLSVTFGNTQVQCLVVGSGGDGGVCGGGGGGAGGVVYHPTLTISPGTYPVTVGASPGISPTGSPCGYRNDGNDSSFNNPSGPWSLVGKGGGAGGGADSQVGRSGGSSGGNSYPTSTVGSATQPGQSHSGAPPGWLNYGNAGGVTPGSPPAKGGGGSGTAGGLEGGNPSKAWGGRAQEFPAFPGPLFTPMPSPWQSAVVQQENLQEVVEHLRQIQTQKVEDLLEIVVHV